MKGFNLSIHFGKQSSWSHSESNIFESKFGMDMYAPTGNTNAYIAEDGQ